MRKLNQLKEFILQFSQKYCPINALLKKGDDIIVWTDECQYTLDLL